MTKLRQQNITLVPEELLPFIQTPAIERLRAILAHRPELYWHPIVRAEIEHLRRREHELDRISHVGAQEADVRHQQEAVNEVSRALQSLVTAHADGILPWLRVAWRPRKKRGPRAGLTNPYPHNEPTRFIDSIRVEQTWKQLHRFFRAREKDLHLGGRPGSTTDEAVERITTMAINALDRSNAYLWSSRHTLDVGEPPPGVSVEAHLLEAIWAADKWYWDIDLRPAVQPVVNRKLSPRMRREGVPAYLAYATLGALLDTSAETVREKIENHRAACRKRARKTTPSA
ncbi:MAG: hypothetical protein HY271_14425 [Deltaproteobacteria bacterium]|nr:hypothetical protein [Deltaproteobacteria bacterium]